MNLSSKQLLVGVTFFFLAPGPQKKSSPHPRHRNRLRIIRFRSLPVTAMYDCQASVSTQQKEERKKKCRKAATKVHITWKQRIKRDAYKKSEERGSWIPCLTGFNMTSVGLQRCY